MQFDWFVFLEVGADIYANIQLLNIWTLPCQQKRNKILAVSSTVAIFRNEENPLKQHSDSTESHYNSGWDSCTTQYNSIKELQLYWYFTQLQVDLIHKSKRGHSPYFFFWL